MMSRLLIFKFFLLFAITACSSGGSSNGATQPGYSVDLNFQRVESGTLNPFIVTATIKENGQLKGGLSSNIGITLSRGTHNAITEVATGQYQFTVTPTQTGEHKVTVNYNSTTRGCNRIGGKWRPR